MPHPDASQHQPGSPPDDNNTAATQVPDSIEATATKSPSRWQRRRAIHVLGGLFVTGLIAGYAVGHALSPVFDLSPGGQLGIRDAVGLFTEPTSRADPKKRPGAPPEYNGPASRWREYVVSYDSSPRLESIVILPDYLTYECGIKLYRYDITSQQVATEPSPRPDVRNIGPARRGLELVDALTFAVGGAKAYQLNKTVPRYLNWVAAGQVSSVTRRVVAASVSMLTGAAFGLYLGYRNGFNCGTKEVQSLLETPAFWVAVNTVVRERYSWYFIHTSPSQMAVDPKRGAGSFDILYQGNMYEALSRVEKK